jgi:hypothetical protein
VKRAVGAQAKLSLTGARSRRLQYLSRWLQYLSRQRHKPKNTAEAVFLES